LHQAEETSATIIDESARQFSAFEHLGKDHLMGIRMLNGVGRPNIMYGLRGGRPEVMDIVQPGKAIGFVPAGASPAPRTEA